jgi:2-hydroxycyclohexanecarboxyl-CoA dehydrogenase
VDTGIDGRTALVTGASGAIGRAAALSLAAEGAAVALTYRHNAAAAADVVETIRGSGGTAHALHWDQTAPETAPDVLGQITAELGPPTIAVANAVQWPSFDDAEIPGLTAALHANTIGPLALIDAALPAMRAAGWGRIVAVSTDVVAQPMAGALAYATAKGALETAARILAVREARHGILTNVVRPGFTLTDRALTAPFLGPKAVAAESARTPTGRICTPGDVAQAITYLASQANGHINGQTVSLAGGRELVR